MKKLVRIFVLLIFPVSGFSQIQWTLPDSYEKRYAESNDTIIAYSRHMNFDSSYSFHFEFYDTDGLIFHDTIDTVPSLFSYHNLKSFESGFIALGRQSLVGDINNDLMFFQLNGNLVFRYEPDTSMRIFDFTIYQDSVYLLVSDSVLKVITLDPGGNQVSEFIADSNNYSSLISSNQPYIHIKNNRIYTVFELPMNSVKCFDMSGTQLWSFDSPLSRSYYNLDVSDGNYCAVLNFESFVSGQWDMWRAYVTMLDSAGQLVWDKRAGNSFSSFYYSGDIFFGQDSLYVMVPYNSFITMDPANGDTTNAIFGNLYSSYGFNDATILWGDITRPWPPPINYNVFEVFDISNGIKVPVYTDTIYNLTSYTTATKFLVPKPWGFYFANVYDFGKFHYTTTAVDSEIYTSDNVKIYPNPSADFFELRGLNGNYESYAISNLVGHMIDYGNLTGKWIETIDLGNYDSGIYLLNLKNQNNSYSSFKLVKY